MVVFVVWLSLVTGLALLARYVWGREDTRKIAASFLFDLAVQADPIETYKDSLAYLKVVMKVAESRQDIEHP